MNVIPKLKNCITTQGICDAEKIRWSFAQGTDARVLRAAGRICDAVDGIPALVSHGDAAGEGYSLAVEPDRIVIRGEGAAGAFYALTTLKMLRQVYQGRIPCCQISDSPDMPYRGFYQDTTRGRVPTLETLKQLVDIMAEYKLNSLQLYVEHTYELREYAHCRHLGFLTKEEIQELDAYCHEQFVELVPSLSAFGHLYHLLQNPQYQHLCELKDYVPSEHYWIERMLHHTINPLLEESFALVTSMIDQHMEAFTSDKFNICCDETFDLGRDVNRDHDKGELYIGFVKKLVAHLESKGKTAIMWSDIVLHHADRIEELPENVIFGAWDYGQAPDESNVAPLQGRALYVCPGTTSWIGFHEYVQIEEGNILGMVEYGKKYGALGILNTNWGDLGNTACIDMAMYGLILGGCAGWNTQTRADAEFKSFLSQYHYGCAGALELLEELSGATEDLCWKKYLCQWQQYAQEPKDTFERAMDRCEAVIGKLQNASFRNPEMKQRFLLAAQADALVIRWIAAGSGHSLACSVDFETWLAAYERSWLVDSKRSELDEILRVCRCLNDGHHPSSLKSDTDVV